MMRATTRRTNDGASADATLPIATMTNPTAYVARCPRKSPSRPDARRSDVIDSMYAVTIHATSPIAIDRSAQITGSKIGTDDVPKPDKNAPPATTANVVHGE